MSDTIAALATPYGESAISAIRISGDETRAIFAAIFGIKEPVPNKLYHKKYLSLKGDILDDVMAVFFRAPRSYTGEDSAEIYMHGNILIASTVLDDLCSRGCRLAERGEFTRRAFLNDKLDLCQAEAVVDLIHAGSVAALQVSQSQLSGGLSAKITEINTQLINTLALLETHIDFIDDEIENNKLNEQFYEKLKKTTTDIEALLATNRYREALFGGLNIAIIGRPNAGKSSLLNLLLNSERALVSPIAGTTRDFITESIMLGGYRVNLLDTAGLHEHASSILEELGITKSIEKIKHADAYLFVVDTCDESPCLPDEVRKLLNPTNCCIIENKIDRVDSANFSDFMPECEHIRCAVIQGDHAQISQEIIKFLNKRQILPNELSVVVNSRHVAILEDVRNDVLAASSELSRLNIECAAENIRAGLESLGEIVGRYTTDDMLDRLFSTFCIGK